jgi:ABC-type transport system substrate-binding protein
MPGYQESVTSYDYDPDRARQLLSESQYADNMPRIILNYSGGGGNPPDILVAIQTDWKEQLGIDVELQAIDTAAFLREQRRGTFQIHSDGWSADYPDPEDFVGKLFGTGSQLNYTGYSNPEVDALLEEARVETDEEARAKLYAEAEQIVVNDAIVIPTYWPVEHMLIKPCVKGYPDPSMTVPKYRFISIEP